MDVEKAVRTTEVKYVGNAATFALTVGSGLAVHGHETWLLTDQSGVLRLNVPKQMWPHLRLGETAIVTFGIVQAYVESTILKATEH